MAFIDVIIQGTNLNSMGLVTDDDSTSALGIQTFGFVLACSDIWETAEEDIETVWTDCGPASPGPGDCLD